MVVLLVFYISQSTHTHMRNTTFIMCVCVRVDVVLGEERGKRGIMDIVVKGKEL